METVRHLGVESGGSVRLCVGDLASLELDDAVDVLVVSAFPDNYMPTPTSMIGALHRRGVSVAALAEEKYVDLRATTSCWLSRPVDAALAGFRQLLCFEPRTGVQAAESVGDIFRALVPFIDPSTRTQSVAMPLLATGAMGRSAEEMIAVILEAAVRWMENGLSLASLQVVLAEQSHDMARVVDVFDRCAREYASRRTAGPAPRPRTSDIFVSYAHSDGAEAVELLSAGIADQRPDASLFVDRLDIEIGSAWQQKIYDALNQCQRVVAVLTPGYLVSKVCQEEMNIARLRERESSDTILFPVYALSAELPPHFRVLNYVDCREMDRGMLTEACAALAASLSAAD